MSISTLAFVRNPILVGLMTFLMGAGLASAALCQDYTYLTEFGSIGNGNGQFHDPQGVAIDPTSHNIVVTDFQNNRVQIFNSAGVYLSQFGSLGNGNGQFFYPPGVAIDPTSHNIVVTDYENARVQIFNSAGVYLSQFGSDGNGNSQFNAIAGVAIDPASHNIVVADAGNNRVQTFNSAGVYQGQFGTVGSGNGQFQVPFWIAIDPTSRNIVVIDRDNFRVQIFNSLGVYLSQFGTRGIGNGQFSALWGIAIDATSHNIVVADTGSNRVETFDAAGNYLSQFGTSGTGNGQFLDPLGVAIDATSHNIVVSDVNSRIQIFAPPVSATPSLLFPLRGLTADTAPINSIFDHSMRNRHDFKGVTEVRPYSCDGRVIAYTGEIGLLARWPNIVPKCTNQPGYQKPTRVDDSSLNRFTVNGHYLGAGTPQTLNYEGHPGIDYQAPLTTLLFSAINGTIEYPKDIVGARNGRAAKTFHTLGLIPDGFPDYRIYYMHLSSHPLDFTNSRTKTVNDPNAPACPATVTFPLAAGTTVKAGCLIALSGDAGTCTNKQCAPHLHIEVQRRIPLANLGSARARVQASMTCPDDLTMACIPVDPYGWSGAPTDCATIGDLNADPADPAANNALGDYYECDTSVRAVRLWK